MNFTGTVLLADDEAHIRKFISLVFKKLGTPRIIEATNGEEAIEAYKRENPDLVLLDVNMPKLDGIGALRQIRAADPDSVIVMLTSLVNRETVEEALRLGAVNYIRKDTPPTELVAQLSTILVDCFGEEA